MRSACVFPGQGAQSLGMGEKLFSLYPELVERAHAILGYSIVDLCLKDTNHVLNNTEYTQPALFFVNALSYLEYTKKFQAPIYLAGHSLGEYNALVAAGVLTIEEGLKIVAIRGKLMSEATNGSMAAIIGLSREKLFTTIETNFPELEISNYNSYTQNVISGPTNLVESSERLFCDMGAKYIKLNVSGAFHSSYMIPVQKKFNNFLERVKFNKPLISIISNYTTAVYNIENLRENLSMYLVSSVKWLETTVQEEF